MRSGRAYIAETDILCGSTAEMSKCVRHFKEVTGNLNNMTCIIYRFYKFNFGLFKKY